MDFLLASLVIAVVAALIAAAFYMRAYYRGRARMAQLAAQAQTFSEAAEAHVGLAHKLEETQALRTRAETQLTEKEAQLEALERKHASAQQAREEALAAQREAEKQVELVQQRIAEREAYWKDLEQQRENAVRDAKAAVMKAGGDLSSKLLEDHKRELVAAKKASEETTKHTTDHLVKEFKGITEAVASIRTQSEQNRDKMATVWRALSTPAGAGQLAEVGLENSLKNLGLETPRDFIMQYTIGSGEGIGLRPDAVLFLPQDIVMVVDSKASKFSLEIAEAEAAGEEALALERLAKSMNTHLRALQSKDYKAAVQDAYRAAGRSGKISAVHTVMYLPNESAVEHIKRADAGFMHKVEKAGLILAGPASLSGLLSLASVNIGMARQAENQDDIMEKVQELMDSLMTMFDHAASLGRNLKTAANFYDKFAGSVNSRVLPKLRSLTQLGVRPASNKELPGRIISYDIRLADEVITLEAAPDAKTPKTLQRHEKKEPA